MNLLKMLLDKISGFAWPRILMPKSGEGQTTFSSGEKALVFGIAYAIAFGLWLMVNLDREFTLTLDLPLVPGEISNDMALVNSIPNRVTVAVSGEGWKLLNFYNSPPLIPVNMSEQNVNLSDQVFSVLASYPDINVLRVNPSQINVTLEDRIEKRVPVDLQMDITFRNQFNFVGQPQLSPDSVTISGARSRVQDIESWPTEVLVREGVRENINIQLELRRPHEVVQISATEVQVSARVSEYTEGELRIPVYTRGLPRGRDVIFSPASVLVRYDVPLEEYQNTQENDVFSVYIDYADIIGDDTGLVVPTIEQTLDVAYIRLRSIQPRTLSYYVVITGN